MIKRIYRSSGCCLRGLAIAVLCCWFSWPATAQTAAPVTLGGRTLFEIKARVGSFQPEARARAIQGRLETLTANPFQTLPPLRLVGGAEGTDLYCGDSLLLTITEADAQAENMTREALAARQILILAPVLREAHWSAWLGRIMGGLLRAGAMGLGGIILLFLLRRFLRRLRERIAALGLERFPLLKIQDHELLGQELSRRLVLQALRVLQTLAILGVTIGILASMSALFPGTRGLMTDVLGRLWSLLQPALRAVIDYLPRLLFLILIAFATQGLLKLIRLVFRGLQSGAISFRGFYAEWAEPTYLLVRLLVCILALIVAFPYLPGSGTEAFKGISIFLGVVFSLSSSGLVGNAVAGILITYMRPFKVGDRISVGETTGDVMEKSFLVTRIRTIKNVDITVPNSTLLGAQVQNFSANAQGQGLILHTTITIGYDAPWRTVHHLLQQAADATVGILKDPRPFVLQTSLDDFYVSYQINGYTRDPEHMAALLSELHVNIQETFNQGGVEIMSPHYRSLRDGNTVTIPVEHQLDADLTGTV